MPIPPGGMFPDANGDSGLAPVPFVHPALRRLPPVTEIPQHVVEQFVYSMPAKAYAGADGCVVFESFVGLPIGSRTAIIAHTAVIQLNAETCPPPPIAVTVPAKHMPRDGSQPREFKFTAHIDPARGNRNFPLYNKEEFVAYAERLLNLADAIETPAEGWGHLPTIGPVEQLAHYAALLSVHVEGLTGGGGGEGRRRKGGRE